MPALSCGMRKFLLARREDEVLQSFEWFVLSCETVAGFGVADYPARLLRLDSQSLCIVSHGSDAVSSERDT